ncbi:MAG: ABC transporter substrate-binding protein [Halobacteria archaeon]|nr:ABC transporter substrate-binding protein [Halobacteria archaeon]
MRTRQIVFAVFSVVLVTGVAGAGIGVADAQSSTGCGFPYSSTDATGTNVTVTNEPQRIVTLGPSAAQTMWEIGAKDKVVGLTRYAMYLEGAEKRVNVSTSRFGVYDYEKIANMSVDLVLAPNIVYNRSVEDVRTKTNATIYKFEKAKTIQDIYQKTRLTGRLVGECDSATSTVDWMKEEVRIVRNTVEGEERPTFLYPSSPTFGESAAWWTVSNGTFIHHLLTLAGGNNFAEDKNLTGYSPISNEVVLAGSDSIEWLIKTDDYSYPPRNLAYNSTYAVKNNQVIYLDSNYLSQPAPRTVTVLGKVAKAFHPDKYLRERIKVKNPRQGVDTGVGTGTGTNGSAVNPTNESSQPTLMGNDGGQDNEDTDTGGTTTQQSSTSESQTRDGSAQDGQESQQRGTDTTSNTNTNSDGGSGMVVLLIGTLTSLAVIGFAVYRYLNSPA